MTTKCKKQDIKTDICDECLHVGCSLKKTIQRIEDIKKDSRLSIRDISDIVDAIYTVGVRKNVTFEDGMIHECNANDKWLLLKENLTFEDGAEGYYYDFTGKDLIEKEDSLGMSKEDFLTLILEWKDLNAKIHDFENKIGGILDTNKHRENTKKRDECWLKIENVFKRFLNPEEIPQGKPTTDNNGSSDDRPKRVIDSTRLMKCFTTEYKGRANVKIKVNLYTELEKYLTSSKMSKKEIAEFAYHIQKSKYADTTIKHKDFKVWYIQFCEMIGEVPDSNYKKESKCKKPSKKTQQNIGILQLI